MRKAALIVDPKDRRPDSLLKYFSAEHYEVLGARSSNEAMNVCRKYKGALKWLITDVELPDSSGWDLAENATRARPGLLVLFLPLDHWTACERDAPARHCPELTDDADNPTMLVEVIQLLSRRTLQHKRIN